MLRKLLSRTIFVAIVGALSGCGTTMNSCGLWSDIVPQLTPFGGTALDIAVASHGPGDEGIRPRLCDGYPV